MSAKNLAAVLFSISVGERLERFENELAWSELHVATHLIEIQPRVDQCSVGVEDHAADEPWVSLPTRWSDFVVVGNDE